MLFLVVRSSPRDLRKSPAPPAMRTRKSAISGSSFTLRFCRKDRSPGDIASEERAAIFSQASLYLMSSLTTSRAAGDSLARAASYSAVWVAAPAAAAAAASVPFLSSSSSSLSSAILSPPSEYAWLALSRERFADLVAVSASA